MSAGEDCGYDAVLTGDGSLTFYNPEFNETYHSITGAIEESFEKFVKPSNIPLLLDNDEILILDICFGLGYNSCAAIDYIRKHNKSIRIRIVALECDISLRELVKTQYPSLKHYHLIRKVMAHPASRIDENNISIGIIWGDARTTIRSLDESFDTCFLDPFNPKACPGLWQDSFIADISGLMGSGSVLTTYSCANIVRTNLSANGFRVSDGPCVGRRAPSTVAVKS